MDDVMSKKLYLFSAGLAALAIFGLMCRCSAPPCPECPARIECPSVDVEARDVQIRALAEMAPDVRTEEIATLLEECLR